MLPRDFLHELLWWFDELSESDNHWSISPKTVLILLKNFRYFKFYKVEKQSMKTLSSNRSKNYGSVVVGDSAVIFLGKERMQLFVHFFVVFYFYTALQSWRSKSSNFLVCYISGGISLSLAAFLLLIFVSTTPSSSWIKCLSFISSWQLIILW